MTQHLKKLAGETALYGLSSIVGRFLEHSRVYHFLAGGEGLTLCSSADWMGRNLKRRVEACFPIEPAALRERVVSEGLLTYLLDNSQAWELHPDGTYVRLSPAPGEDMRRAQDILLGRLAASPPTGPAPLPEGGLLLPGDPPG